MDNNYQGRELQCTLRANTLPELQRMLSELQEFARNEEMDEIELLRPPTKDVDGGFVTIITAHNLNVISWAKERWSSRGGGLEARLKREQEEREKRLKETKLRTEASKEKARQEKERAASEAERARAEKELLEQRVGTRKSVQARREAARLRRREELGMRLESFEEGVRRVGGFAGAQAATFETALYTPFGVAEEASKTAREVRPKGPTRPLMQDIFDTRLPY